MNLEREREALRFEEERIALQHLLSSSTFTNMSFMDNTHAPHVHGPSCNHEHDHEEGTNHTNTAKNGQAGTIGE